MDERESMASFFMHSGIGGVLAPAPIHNLRPIAAAEDQIAPSQHQPCSVGGGSFGSAFQVVEPLLPSILHHGGAVDADGGGGVAPPPSGEPPVKKKRGRPRKYGPDGNIALALSPSPSSPGSGSGSVSRPAGANRGRGRPPGTGMKQLLAPLGRLAVGSAGMGFTPHVITVAYGEDIAAKVMSFSQQGLRAVCVLTANGSVSKVTLRQPSSPGGAVSYEGHFEILSLSGSYLRPDDGESSQQQHGWLSVTLSSPEGQVIGGGVGGILEAASYVQVIVASFNCGGSSKAKAKAKQQRLEEFSPGPKVEEEEEGEEGGGDDEEGDDGEASAPIGGGDGGPAVVHMTHQIFGGWPLRQKLDVWSAAHTDMDPTHGG